VRIVDLHALFDDWVILADSAVSGGSDIPSKGFIRASLAIVAQAPLVAGQVLVKSPQKTEGNKTYQQREGDGHQPGYLP
jgi:hypothetical protein